MRAGARRAHRRPNRRALGLAAACSALVAGCLPAAASSEARDVTALYIGFMAIAAVVAAIVFGVTTWSIVRYRARRDEPATAARPPQIRGSTRLEAIWTAIPIVTVLALFGATLLVLSRMEATSNRPGAVIRVEAFRWGWTFTYPAAGITISGIGSPGPEVVVPVGQPIRLTIASADVVHSFYVPQFLFKRDAVPGRESTFEFTAPDPGTYRGQCAEFCGIYHARMPFAVRAVPRAEYDAWVLRQPKTTPGSS